MNPRNGSPRPRWTRSDFIGPSLDDRRLGLRFRYLMGAGLVCLVSLAISSLGHSQEQFESAEPSWQVGEDDCQLVIQTHRRTFDVAHSGHGSEYLQFRAAKGGQKALFAHPIKPARVIDELVASVWVKSPQIGCRFSARVVLPRSKDPRTGRPLTALLEGDIYSTPGVWGQLRVENLPLLLSRQTRLLRSAFGTADSKEAYIDAVVINGYCGDGVTEIWIDDLEVSGFAPRIGGASSLPAGTPPVATSAVPSRSSSPEIRVRGSHLEIDGTPFFARIVDWSGEQFEFLAEMGFNVVRLDTPPTAEQAREAARLDLWLVAPLPNNQPASRAASDRILCWQLGDRLAARDLLSTTSRIASLRKTVQPPHPPILCGVDDSVAQYAEQTDLLQLTKLPIGTSFDLSDSATWWRQVGGTVRPIKPFWARIQTELSPTLVQQISGLNLGSPPETDVEPEQLWLQTLSAVAGGARGIAFQSRTRLDGHDRSSRRRGAALRVMNAYLTILDPWCAAGQVGQPIRLRTPGYFATSLEMKRSRLLIVCRAAAEQQYLVGPGSNSGALQIPLPDRRVGDQAFKVTGGGLQRLPASTGAAGSFSLADPGLFSFVVLWNDPSAVNHLGRKSDAARNPIVENATAIGSLQLEETREVLRAMATFGRSNPADAARLAFVESSIEEVRRLTYRGDLVNAMRFLEEAKEQLRAIRRDHWRAVALQFSSPIASPLCTTFRTLGSHWDLAERMQRVRWGPNVMAAGRFEELEHLLATGWAQSNAATGQIETKVELSLESPRSGRRALKLQAWSDADRRVADRWPVWITSSSVHVQTGQIIRIEGAARVDDEIVGSKDGLMIFDTMTGAELATRIHSTRGWREFQLFRVAPSSGELSIVIALTGIGSASIDDLQVFVGSPPEPRQATRAPR